jgi:hypothetical protein
MVLLFTISADIAHDCVTGKRNSITKLAPFFVITYIELC